MSGECQVNVKSQSELDIGGRETCYYLILYFMFSPFIYNVLLELSFSFLLQATG